MRNNKPIKDFTKLIEKLIKATYNSKDKGFKLDDYPIQRRVYLPTFMD